MVDEIAKDSQGDCNLHDTMAENSSKEFSNVWFIEAIVFMHKKWRQKLKILSVSMLNMTDHSSNFGYFFLDIIIMVDEIAQDSQANRKLHETMADNESDQELNDTMEDYKGLSFCNLFNRWIDRAKGHDEAPILDGFRYDNLKWSNCFIDLHFS